MLATLLNADKYDTTLVSMSHNLEQGSNAIVTTGLINKEVIITTQVPGCIEVY